jgi:hypothetical protein
MTDKMVEELACAIEPDWCSESVLSSRLLGVDDMTNCDFLNTPHRDNRLRDYFGDPDGEGEKEYREHVSAHRLSLGEIIVVVAAVVLIAGMGLFNQSSSPVSSSAVAALQSEHRQLPSLMHCDDDDADLARACQP